MNTSSTSNFLTISFLVLLASCDSDQKRTPDPLGKLPAHAESERVLTFSEDKVMMEISTHSLSIIEKLNKHPVQLSQVDSLNAIVRAAKTASDLRRALKPLCDRPEDILEEVSQIQALVQKVGHQNRDLEGFARKLAKLISGRSIQTKQSQLRTSVKPDCAGICSQQFNIDIAMCENDLALEIGMALYLGELSGGILGSAALIFAIASYNSCENGAFMSHGNCVDSCMN